MCSENMTSLGRTVDRCLSPEERGVETDEALALHKYAPVQSLLAVLTTSPISFSS